MVKQLVLCVPLVGIMTLGCLQFGSTRRTLNELGSVSVPRRLETSGPYEEGTFSIFSFDRSAWWPMGSNRPVPERLSLAVWTPASRAAARAFAIKDARDRTDSIQWRREGPFEIGEGLHSVNTAENPTWIVVGDYEDRGMTIAYMVWKKDASLDKARRMVTDVFASFKPDKPLSEYLEIARARPGKEREGRLGELDAALAARGVRLTMDGGAVEKDGAIHELYTDPKLGKSFIMLFPLGAMPPKERYQHLRPPTPRNVGNWPSVIWFVRGANGQWEHHGVDSDWRIGPHMLERVAALKANDSALAHFYAIDLGTIEDLNMPAFDMEFFVRASTAMAALFRDGKLIR